MKLLLGDNFYYHDWCKQIEFNEEYRKNFLRVHGVKVNGNHANGIDINVEGWICNGNLQLLTCNVIDSKLMEGDVGPDVGFMGATVRELKTTSKLYKETIEKIIMGVAKVNYNGPITMYCTICDNVVLVKHMIARINKATVYIILDMLKEDDSFIMENIHTNLLPKLNFISQYGVCFLIAVPPFPYSFDYSIRVKLDGLTDSNIKHIWLNEIYGDEIDTTDGVVGVITARGDSIDNWHPIRDARRRIFRTINNLKIENLMYRRDVGIKAQETLERIKQWL